MHYTVKIFGYDGQAKAILTCEGHRGTVCELIASEPGAAHAEVTDGLGRVETIGKGAAFVTADGPQRRALPVMRYAPARKARAVRAPRSWYGADIVA